MSLQKRPRDLQILVLLREHQKNFNRDYRLQKRVTKKLEDLLKPLIQQKNN